LILFPCWKYPGLLRWPGSRDNEMQTFHIGRSIKLMNTSPWIFLAAALFAVAAVAPTASAQIGVGVSVTLAPPALPVYTQPLDARILGLCR
jgi:hypothetical protein